MPASPTPVAFVAASDTRTSDGATLNPQIPSTVQAGDTLLLFATSYGLDVATSYSAPAGWTLLASKTDSTDADGPRRLWVWVKTAAAGDAGAQQSLINSTGERSGNFMAIAAVLAYRNVTLAVQGAVAQSPTPPPVGFGGAVLSFSVSRNQSTGTEVGANERAFGGYAQTGWAGTYYEAADWLPGGSHQAGPKATVGGFGVSLSATVALRNNTAPNAPALATPTGGASIDLGVTQRFSWAISDPDLPGDSQSKADVRYRPVGATSWTDVTVTSPNPFWDAPAGTFTAGDYEWQARTYDALGLVGPYSSSGFFTTAVSPGGPTITAPTSGATVSTSEALTWSAPDQDGYQARRVADVDGAADTGTVYWDSGEVTDPEARTAAVAFPVNGRWEHVQVRVKNDGLWGPWADVRVQVSWTPPAPPTVTLTPAPEQAALTVTVTNPTPVEDEPAVAYNDIYLVEADGPEWRAATQVPPGGSWTYLAPASGVAYAARAVAVADNGTTASSPLTDGSQAAINDGIWL